MTITAYRALEDGYEKMVVDETDKEGMAAINELPLAANTVHVRFSQQFMSDAVYNRRRGEQSPFDCLTPEHEENFISVALDVVIGELRKEDLQSELKPYLLRLRLLTRAHYYGAEGSTFNNIKSAMMNHGIQSAEGSPVSPGKERLG